MGDYDAKHDSERIRERLRVAGYHKGMTALGLQRVTVWVPAGEVERFIRDAAQIRDTYLDFTLRGYAQHKGE